MTKIHGSAFILRKSFSLALIAGTCIATTAQATTQTPISIITPGTTTGVKVLPPLDELTLAKNWMERLSRLKREDYTHGGGGGTFIEIPGSVRALEFWDLYSQNVNFRDSTPGEPLHLKSPAGILARGEWLLDQTNLRADKYLESRLDQFAHKIPMLVDLLRNKRNTLRIFLTEYSLTAVREVSNSSLESNPPVAIPGAFYQDAAGWAYLDIKIWNQVGLQSQAALLLHERLRRIQIAYGLSNTEIQKIVSQIITGDPKDKFPVEDFQFTLEKEPIAMRAYSDSVPLNAMFKIPAADVMDFAVGSGVLFNGPLVRAKLQNEGARISMPANGGTVLLDAAKCRKLVAQNLGLGFDLRCVKGQLVGSGELVFKSAADEFSIEVGMTGYGFNFEVSKASETAPGFRIDVVAQDNSVVISTPKSAPIKISKVSAEFTSYTLDISKAKRLIELNRQSTGGKREKMASWSLPEDTNGDMWSFGLDSQESYVQYIRLFPYKFLER